MTEIKRGKVVHLNGELMVEHTPRKVFAELGGRTIHKTFYLYDMLDPFTKHNLKEGDEVVFVFEWYIDNGGFFKFCEIVD